MMDREPAQHDIEGSVGEGQLFGCGLLGHDVAEAPLGGGPLHLRQHVGREIAGHHLANHRGGPVGDVATAATQIENARFPLPGQEGLDLVEIGPATVHRAANVGCGSGRIMAGHKVVLRVVHPASPVLMQRSRLPIFL